MTNYFGLLDIGTPELIIILAIILLLFGGKKLPQLSRSIGESMKELRKGVSTGYNEGSEKEPNTKKDQDVS